MMHANPSSQAMALTGVTQALVAARRTGHPVPALPWHDAITTAAEVYAVQDAVAQAMGWFAGGPAQFWKSGGGSRNDVMTHAALPPQGVRPSGSTLADLPSHAPAIEAEIALRLGVAITPEHAATLTFADCASLVDAMAVTIEVADSRWSEAFQAPPLLRLADSGCHSALLVGDWVDYAPRNWAEQRCEVQIGEQALLVRTGSHTLADPLWLLPAWLRHATRNGQTVPAGTAVTTGSWIGAVHIPVLAAVRVEFPGIGVTTLRV
jgi:2-keto-4-pentenoate hydratase